MFKTSDVTLKLALDAEDANIKRLLTCNKKKMGSNEDVSVDAFHCGLVAFSHTMTVPTGVNATVAIGIDAVCDPIIEKIQRQRKKLMAIVGSVCLCTCLTLFALWGIPHLGVDSTGEDSSEDDLGTSDDEGESVDNSDDATTTITYTSEYTATHYADIVIDGHGTITVALDANKAPITVENFVSLASTGFYDGLTFHRILEGFIMQGGDPDANGYGGNTDETGNEITLTGEFTANGSDNNLSHTRGAISMVRSENDYNSASSQFFIVHTSDYIDSLDGQYAVFGYVTEGMDIVDAICEAAYTMDEYEIIDASEQPVITSITIRVAEDDASDAATANKG